jgi:glycine cleavage system regulatory protein
VTGRRGRKWGQLRGEYLEVRELAGVLRDVASGHGLTLRDLEVRMPYGHTVIAENLNGEKRPTWEFVAAFLDACAGHDRQARELLESKVKRLWDAAAPGRANRLAAVAPGATAELVPAGLHAWVTTLRETAFTQQTVASLQLSVSRHMGLVNNLTVMLNQLTVAAETLTDERDALREELRAHTGTADELRRTRMLLEETQRRLDAAEQFQAETSRRLDDALRQREEAERLKQAALRQAEAARRRLADLEQHAVSFVDHPPGEQEPIGPDRSLMGTVDQSVAAEILRRVDDTLEEEADNLERLQNEVSAASADNTPLSAGQSARMPTTTQAAQVTTPSRLAPAANATEQAFTQKRTPGIQVGAVTAGEPRHELSDVPGDRRPWDPRYVMIHNPSFASATVFRWLKQEGDAVAAGEELVQVAGGWRETAVSLFGGVLRRIVAAEGEQVEADAVAEAGRQPSPRRRAASGRRLRQV